MSICDKCNVEVEPSLKYCPLCGRNVNAEAKNAPANYPPDSIWKKNRIKTCNVLALILVCLVVGAILADIIFFKRVALTLHILFPSLLLFFSVLLPIKQNWSISNENNIFLILSTLYFVWLESVTPFKGWALAYVIPLILLAISIYNFFVIILRKYNRFEHFSVLMVSGIISVVIFITNSTNSHRLWPTIAAFSASVALLFFVIMLKRKNVKNELVKKFHI
ncbi:MAG: DUF6320 domain-containing protein [Clostridia bacterium]